MALKSLYLKFNLDQNRSYFEPLRERKQLSLPKQNEVYLPQTKLENSSKTKNDSHLKLPKPTIQSLENMDQSFLSMTVPPETGSVKQSRKKLSMNSTMPSNADKENVVPGKIHKQSRLRNKYTQIYLLHS